MDEVIYETEHLLEAKQPFVLATMVDSQGSTPQKVGAKLLVRADGSTLGTMGGGCVEAEVWQVAMDTMGSGEPRVLDFALNEDLAIDYGLACGGTELILVDPTTSRDLDTTLVRDLETALRGERRGALLTVVRGNEGTPVGAKLALWEDGETKGELGSARVEGIARAMDVLRERQPKPRLERLPSGIEVFIDVYEAPPEVVIAGAGYVGKAVATLAKFLNYRVTVIDDREDFANRERFPEADTVITKDIDEALLEYPISRNSAVVIVTRGHKYDYQALAAAAKSPAYYVGLMGSKRKVLLIYRQLLADGVPFERLRDIRAPIGLSVGAVSPEEIALSIMSEITMLRLGGNGQPLKVDERHLHKAQERVPV
jgi:xanthine dehydrogenase accessory factor